MKRMYQAWSDSILQATGREVKPHVKTIDTLIHLPEDQRSIWHTPLYFSKWRIAAEVKTNNHRHCLAHAQTGFWGSPFESAIIIVTHGSGFDGTHNVYLGTRGTCGLVLLWNEPSDPPDVGMKRLTQKPFVSPSFLLSTVCNELGWTSFELCSVMANKGQPRAGGAQCLHKVYAMETKWENHRAHDRYTTKADWAAAAHQFYVEHVTKPLQHYPALVAAVEGIVVSGAGGYNRDLNTYLSANYHKPVHVPSVVRDDNLAMGYVLDVLCPAPGPDHHFLGPPLAPPGASPYWRHGQDAGPREVARLLHHGAVIAVMRGRAESNPVLSLGHRTLIGHPTTRASEAFSLRGKDPYIAFRGEDAPDIVKEADRRSSSSLIHFTLLPAILQRVPFLRDQTTKGRVVGLTVSPASDQWLAEVLQGLGRQGVPPLVLYRKLSIPTRNNFTTHVVWPLVPNTLEEALQYMTHNALVSHVYFEGRLFTRESLGSMGLNPEPQPMERHGTVFYPISQGQPRGSARPPR